MQALIPITSIYIDPTTDFGFKKLFANELHKDLLMDFLNSMLPEDNQIVSLTFQQPEQLPDFEEDRKAIFDILCEAQSGEKFIIEMQKSRITHFMDRSLFYVTFPIQTQAKKGKWDFELKRVYFMGILDFDYDKNIDIWKRRQLLRSFSLRDDRGVLMTDKLQFKLLQLPFFKKKPYQLKTNFDKWCYFLKNLEDLKAIPKILNEPIFVKAFDIATVSKLSPNEYILYQISKTKKYDLELVAEDAERRGIIKGKIEGKAEGKIEGKAEGVEETIISLVLTLYKKDFTPVQISELMNKPLDDIEEIIEKYLPENTDSE